MHHARLCLRLALVVSAILAGLLFAQLAHAQSALEWAAQGMGATRAKIAQVDRGFARRLAVAEGRLVLTSWYGGGERLNRHTASGEVFRPHGMTAAHRSLPMGTRIAVSYGGRTVVVRVNDRGPAAYTGRSLDLSRGAAAALGFLRQGTARVRIAVLGG